MNKRKLHTRLASATTVAGLALMAGKIAYDSEPGLVPLLLVVLGVAWLLMARRRFPP